MKLIDDDILELAGGGSGTATTTVTVYGERPRDHYYPPAYSDPWGYDYGDPGDSNGGTAGDEPPPPPDEPQHCSPAPALVPAGVDLNHLRNMVVYTAAVISNMSKDIEFASFIFRDGQGQLHQSQLYVGWEDGFRADLSKMPADYKVVAYIHSHPENDIDNRFPSWSGTNGDTDQAKLMIERGMADPNGLLYILDNKSGDVFEYTMAGLDGKRKLGANISDDVCGR